MLRPCAYVDGANLEVQLTVTEGTGRLITVRVNLGTLRIQTLADQTLDSLAAVRRLGPTRSREVLVIDPEDPQVLGRVCVRRKTRVAVRTAHQGWLQKNLRHTCVEPRPVVS